MRFSYVALVLFALAVPAQGQRLADSAGAPRHTLYAELGGVGPLYSLNYELRLGRRSFIRLGGSALRIDFLDENEHVGGIAGFYWTSSKSYAPQGRYALRAEFGLAAQAFRYRVVPWGLCFTDCDPRDREVREGEGLYLSPSIGVRSEPARGHGLFVRLALTPVLSVQTLLTPRAERYPQKVPVIPWAGVSLGYAF